MPYIEFVCREYTTHGMMEVFRVGVEGGWIYQTVVNGYGERVAGAEMELNVVGVAATFVAGKEVE